MRKQMGQSTQSIWGGEQEHELFERSTQVPVVHSVSFAYKDIDTWQKVALGQEPGHIYSRNTNPTVRAFEDKVKTLEGAQAATSFASGMAAISNTLATFVQPGDRIVSIKDSYGGTNVIFNEFLPPLGIDVALCETGDYVQLEAEIAKGCRLLYLETPTNPTIKITDIERLAAKAHAVGALVVVDNTFATPINQLPLELGADIVLHSASKYLGGHADALGGVICGSHELVEKVYHYREINGATLAPMDAYSLLRGMKTLKLRVERHNSNAMAIAHYLQSHPMVDQVNYPGLESHPGHDIAKQQMFGFGGMLSFSVKGGLEAIKLFLPKLQFAHMAANLGCVETVVGPPVTTSHVECSAEERAAAGIPEGLVRYSAGIEDIEDLIADLEQALGVLKIGSL
ncbi:cystathionine gamma-synthase family protein [bacterium]|mgnify:FL=1|jgi:cystathionine gamma-synthase|nr:cystathionine gamma-synthase family protein [Oceanospirillaceae bacterium]MDA9279797.1 cystathionine gamma-synthase family protein [bacterium]MBT5628908.1 cystathionine gamma-synthase family protein [Oceanospirillaceae bacterium]MDB4536090.1 cystathionine gamma-synthase family protein [Oceanospirillaceae bacterium]MDC0085354.1 cystathionine gamma-synthase family protein [Oceanospirillaceae bacterium]